MNPARRRVIFAGIAGSLLLGLARVLEGPSRPDSAATRGVRGSALSADGADVMRVIAPAILAGALP
ncbi:MAG: hypothetical protein JSS46_10285, partial [Proteobacteria bacterium]|nr:hypothetical protein [Pseudomonadota bacterium]